MANVAVRHANRIFKAAELFGISDVQPCTHMQQSVHLLGFSAPYGQSKSVPLDHGFTRHLP